MCQTVVQSQPWFSTQVKSEIQGRVFSIYAMDFTCSHYFKISLSVHQRSRSWKQARYGQFGLSLMRTVHLFHHVDGILHGEEKIYFVLAWHDQVSDGDIALIWHLTWRPGGSGLTAIRCCSARSDSGCLPRPGGSAPPRPKPGSRNKQGKKKLTRTC